jgi:hypothetical protein
VILEANRVRLPTAKRGYVPVMATADWTYELAPGTADARGLERFVVETSDGERVGTVAALLRHGEDVYVAVERGYPPAHDLRAAAWEDVAAVDDQEHAVRLRIDADKLERELALDPAKKVEGGPADAVRLTELPGLLPTFVEPEETAPPDRPALFVAIGLALAGALTLLLAAAVQGRTGAWSLLLFLVPLVLLAASVVLSFKVYRDPSARRRRPRRPPPERRAA